MGPAPGVGRLAARRTLVFRRPGQVLSYWLEHARQQLVGLVHFCHFVLVRSEDIGTAGRWCGDIDSPTGRAWGGNAPRALPDSSTGVEFTPRLPGSGREEAKGPSPGGRTSPVPGAGLQLA